MTLTDTAPTLDESVVVPAGSGTMTAKAVKDALLGRWPASEYAAVYEAPQAADRGGRKLDVLFLSLWRSRGHELDGVEVKVSVSDWRRELKDADKADWWWRHVHRFWVAAPASVAMKIKPELPAGWGLIGCTAAGTSVLVKPERHDAERLPWTAVVGLIRTCGGAGLNALNHAHSRGREQGYKEGVAATERRSGDTHLRNQLDDLRTRVAAFEETSGVSVSSTYGEDDAARLGRLVKALRRRDPSFMVQELRRSAKQMEDMATALSDALAASE